MVLLKQKRKVCGGIIILKQNNENYILCVTQNKCNKWGPPKGGYEKWENSKECAKREIKEETSLNINYKKFKKKIKIMSNIYFIIKVDKKYTNFKYNPKEISEVSWINIEDIPNISTNRHLKEIYKKRKIILKYC